MGGDIAFAMGNYYFTCATTGEKAQVEYTFGYQLCDDGKVRIFLHHSSVPYKAIATIGASPALTAPQPSLHATTPMGQHNRPSPLMAMQNDDPFGDIEAEAAAELKKLEKEALERLEAKKAEMA